MVQLQNKNLNKMNLMQNKFLHKLFIDKFKNKAITIKKFICFSISLILRSKIIVETIFI